MKMFSSFLRLSNYALMASLWVVIGGCGNNAVVNAAPAADVTSPIMMNTLLVALSAMASTISMGVVDAKSIPRTIIQTSKEAKVDRPDWIEYQTSLATANPNFELVHYSDEEARAFIGEHYGGTILEDTYDIVTPIMRADIFRLAAIYKLGGFYMDMDMLGKASLDPIVNAMDQGEYQAIFPKEWWMSTGYYTSIYPGRTPEDAEDHWQMGQYAFGVSVKQQKSCVSCSALALPFELHLLTLLSLISLAFHLRRQRPCPNTRSSRTHSRKPSSGPSTS